MPNSIPFAFFCRVTSVLFVVTAVLCFGVETFPYKAVFVGLLFPHFLLGFVYSKRNAGLLREKRCALVLASGILLAGLWFSMSMAFVAPYFLVVHAALSDAYLLPLPSRMKDAEHMKLLKTCFYIVCFGLLFITMDPATVAAISSLGVAGFLAIAFYTEDKKSLLLFELPIVLLVLYAKLSGLTLDIHLLGFYHILTWYAFSFWMLFVTEKSGRKTTKFFSMVLLLSVLFIFGFELVLGLSITALEFKRIIAFWSILHISSSIPLSKFNPQFLKGLFYLEGTRRKTT